MYKITSRWGHQKSVSVMWNIGKRCNYDCSYCPAEIHDLTSPNTNLEILKNTVDILSKNTNEVRIMFTGGEPTVHPQFKELLEYINFKNISWVSITTNGTKSSKWYLENEGYWDHLLFSLHFEYNWERVVKTIIAYKEKTSRNFFVNVMAHHNYMDDVKSVIATFDSLNIKYAIRRIRWVEGDDRDVFDDNLYTSDDITWILNKQSTADKNCVVDDNTMMHANDIIKNHQNKFLGWECNAGLESLMINWDGAVHRATCRVGGSVGNIYTGSFQAPVSRVICTREWCTCAADIYISKQIVE